MEVFNVENNYLQKGNIYEEKHGDVWFLFESAMQYVVDAYDDYLGSVELSHYESLGYSEVKRYNMNFPSNTLDLTWMDKEDIFDFEKSDSHAYIENINVNIDNLDYSKLPMCEDGFNNLKMTVFKKGSKKNIIKQAKILKSFIEKHQLCLIRGVELVGFTSMEEVVLKPYLEKYGIYVEFLTTGPEKVR